jgi:hypothetical protein
MVAPTKQERDPFRVALEVASRILEEQNGNWIPLLSLHKELWERLGVAGIRASGQFEARWHVNGVVRAVEFPPDPYLETRIIFDRLVAIKPGSFDRRAQTSTTPEFRWTGH